MFAIFYLTFVASLLSGIQGGIPAPVFLHNDNLLKELELRAQPHTLVEEVGSTTAPLDQIIDFLLAGAVPQIVSKGSPSLPLPDFSFHFNTTLEKVFKIAGGVDAKLGALEDMKSLYRKGASVVRRGAGGALFLEVIAGARVLRVSYRKYSAILNGLHANGMLQMEVSPAAIRAQVALVPPCTAQLQLLQVADLGPFRVKISGLPPSLSGIPKLMESFLAYPSTRQAMQSFVIGHLTELITGALKNLSCKKEWSA